MKLCVFADQGDRDLLRGRLEVVDHLRPVCEVGFGAVQMQTLAGNFGEMFLFHRERRFI